ncbi:MAG: hypothetical protein QOF61_1266 [Acidobacteriota bacterium]|jgi:hypothetical protein|nr:hypothetical protein [Acidobacteriota bacterium]
MKHQQSCLVTSVVRRLAAIISLLLLGAGAALAQAPGGAGAPAVIDPKGETHSQMNREAALRSAEIRSVGGRMDSRQLAAAIDQTKQDFKRIQLIRNDVIDYLVAKKPLDYKLVSEQAAEINKRANRLKTILMPSAPVEKEKDATKQIDYDGEQLKGALVKLCNTIFSFTGNAMFKDPATVDLQKAASAGGDLLTIIELSDNVKRSAERLKASK